MRVRRILLVLPLIALVLWCCSESPAPAPVKKSDEKAALDAIKQINQAQADYIRRTRRYAQSFNELVTEHLMQAEPDEETIGYKFALYPSPDAVSYSLKATPSSPGARHFFTDQSGRIRAEADKPATAESPAVTD